MLEKISETKKMDAMVENKKEAEKNFPCNRPCHIKGKVPTEAQLAYRRTRDGD